MKRPFDASDPDGWKADLLEAGWVEERVHRYRAPTDELFIGPYGAWREMKLAQRRAELGPKPERKPSA